MCFVYSPLRLKWPVIWEQNHLTDEKLYHFELWQKDEDPAVVPVHYECIVHCVLLLYDIRMQLSQNIPIGLMSFKLRQTSVYMVHTDKACIFLIKVFSWCLFDWLHQSEIKKKKKLLLHTQKTFKTTQTCTELTVLKATPTAVVHEQIIGNMISVGGTHSS